MNCSGTVALHSTEFRFTSSLVDRRPRFSLRTFSRFSLLAIAVIVCSFGSSASAHPGREQEQLEAEPKQEFKDNFTVPSSELIMFNSLDLISAASFSTRFARDLRNNKRPKVPNWILEDRMAEETRKSACKKLGHPESATSELLVSARDHSSLVDRHCADDRMVPGCYPSPVLVRISSMCKSLPAAILDYDRLKTFVSRCPTMPCCRVTYACKAKTSIEFNQTFKIQYGGVKIVTIPLRNDTECECGDISCPEKCPKPFRISKERDKCECTCHQKSKVSKETCEQIKIGNLSLTETEKRCVEVNKCRVPVCSPERRYDVREGTCMPACEV